MSPALWWSLWVLSVLAGIGAGYALVRFVAAEVLADRDRARAGVQLAGSVPFARKREEHVEHRESSMGSNGGKTWTPGVPYPRSARDGAVILPFLPREGFSPAEPVQVTDERFPELVAAIREERARLARLREEMNAPRLGWPVARRTEIGLAAPVHDMRSK